MNSKIVPFKRKADTAATRMQEAVTTLKRLDISFERPTEFQLKVGDCNFYPGTGTITFDGENQAEKERGLGAFLAIVQ